MLSPSFIEEMKKQLLLAKKKLEGDLAGIKPHEELGSDLDSNVQEVEDDEVSRGVMSRVNADLKKINRALAKIENGTYGQDDAGHPIAEERLRVMPWADKAL